MLGYIPKFLSKEMYCTTAVEKERMMITLHDAGARVATGERLYACYPGCTRTREDLGSPLNRIRVS